MSRELVEWRDMRYSHLYVLWQLADFKITAQRLFDQDRVCPRLTLTHVLHFFLIHSLACICNDVTSSYLQTSKIFGCICSCISRRFKCSNGVALYNLPFFLFPQTSMSVHPLRARTVGHVWMKWTTSLVSVPKAGLELPARAPCQHVGKIGPHTHVKVVVHLTLEVWVLGCTKCLDTLILGDTYNK